MICESLMSRLPGPPGLPPAAPSPSPSPAQQQQQQQHHYPQQEIHVPTPTTPYQVYPPYYSHYPPPPPPPQFHPGVHNPVQDNNAIRSNANTSLQQPRGGAAPTVATGAGAAIGSHSRQVITVHDHDILCGRGVNIAQHPGNERFRALVNTRHDGSYCTAYTTSEKRAVAKEIVMHIQSLNPPGRFLKRSGRSQSSRGLSGPWEELSDREAIKKTCQALRDCNRADRTGYAATVRLPEDVKKSVEDRQSVGLTNKQLAAIAVAQASQQQQQISIHSASVLSAQQQGGHVSPAPGQVYAYGYGQGQEQQQHHIHSHSSMSHDQYNQVHSMKRSNSMLLADSSRRSSSASLDSDWSAAKRRRMEESNVTPPSGTPAPDYANIVTTSPAVPALHTHSPAGASGPGVPHHGPPADAMLSYAPTMAAATSPIHVTAPMPAGISSSAGGGGTPGGAGNNSRAISPAINIGLQHHQHQHHHHPPPPHQSPLAMEGGGMYNSSGIPRQSIPSPHPGAPAPPGIYMHQHHHVGGGHQTATTTDHLVPPPMVQQNPSSENLHHYGHYHHYSLPPPHHMHPSSSDGGGNNNNDQQFDQAASAVAANDHQQHHQHHHHQQQPYMHHYNEHNLHDGESSAPASHQQHQQQQHQQQQQQQHHDHSQQAQQHQQQQQNNMNHQQQHNNNSNNRGSPTL